MTQENPPETAVASKPAVLSLALGPRSYDILIGAGLLDQIGARLAPIAKGRQAAVVTNEVVAPLYLERVLLSLRQAGFDAMAITLPDGESHKEWPVLHQIFDRLIERRFERSTTLVALGGGVVGDMTGFAAAAFLRGVDFVQLPTTLLAQVDSSVGGKTGINHALGKNLIGAFHQPRLVTIDVATLKSLPRREVLAGLAEVIKYALIDQSLSGGEHSPFIDDLEAHLDGLLALDPAALTPIIRRCCAIKAGIVAADETEKGQRALLNMGHTFGHAIETLAGYGTILHGEAVAMGMAMAMTLARAMGRCSAEQEQRVGMLLKRAGLPLTAPRFPLEEHLAAMGRDKKVEGGRIRFVVPQGVGRAEVMDDLPLALVREAIAAHLAPAADQT